MYKWISFRSNGFLSTHGLFCISIILLFYSEIFLLLFCLSLIANKPRNREKNNIVILILIAIKSTKTHHNTMRAVCLHCFSDLLLLLLGVCVCVSGIGFHPFLSHAISFFVQPVLNAIEVDKNCVVLSCFHIQSARTVLKHDMWFTFVNMWLALVTYQRLKL